MNREIKFRGKVSKSFNSDFHQQIFIYGSIIFSKDDKVSTIITDEFEAAVDTETVGQFTGLLDKNGREIYEGDIVVKDTYIWFDNGEPNYVGVVDFIFCQWQVYAHCINKSKHGISNGINMSLNDEGYGENEKSDWRIIGNIHENPELLTA